MRSDTPVGLVIPTLDGEVGPGALQGQESVLGILQEEQLRRDSVDGADRDRLARWVTRVILGSYSYTYIHNPLLLVTGRFSLEGCCS
jgi:hypothetical protein